MDVGKLHFAPVADGFDQTGAPIQACIGKNNLRDGLWVAAIDPNLADTAAFCAHYDIGLEISANCVIVEAKRADRVWYAACIILATTRVDVNNAVRRHLDARKSSFAPMDTAVSLTHMEYGGITPVGLPPEWPILIDEQVMQQPRVIIGSGVRGSKLLIDTETLAALTTAEVLGISKPSVL